MDDEMALVSSAWVLICPGQEVLWAITSESAREEISHG